MRLVFQSQKIKQHSLRRAACAIACAVWALPLAAQSLAASVSAKSNVLNVSAAAQSAQTTQALAAVNPQSTTKKIITHDVYANWRSIAGAVLSRDGRWAAYALVAQESDGEVVVRRLADGQEWRSARGITPAFSADGQFLAFAIRPSQADLDQAKKAKKKPDELPKNGLGIMNLANGQVEVIERVKRFAWPEEGGHYLAVLLEAKDEKKNGQANAKEDANEFVDDDQQVSAGKPGNNAKKKDSGSDLMVLDAATTARKKISNVAQFVWAKNGTRLGFSVALKDTDKAKRKGADGTPQNPTPASSKVGDAEVLAEGAYLISPVDMQIQNVLSGAGSYKQLQLDEAGQQFAFVTNRDDLAQKLLLEEQSKMEKSATSDASKSEATSDAKQKDDDKEPGVFKLFFWRAGDATAQAVVSSDTPGMSANWSPSEFGALQFSKDGQRLFFGTAEISKPEPKDAPEIVKVDLWHWKDPELQSVQKVKAEKDKQKHFLAVLHTADLRFVQLATPSMPQVLVNDNAQFAMGVSDLPYRQLLSWDSLYYDVFAVDLQHGQARALAQKLRFPPSLSPAGKYVLAFDAGSGQWLTWRTADGSKAVLSAKLKTQFADLSRDTPEPREAYGYAGWTADDASVVLYDQYDLWQVDPRNVATARNLSNGFGRKNKLELRYLNLDPEKRGLTEEPSPLVDSKALPTNELILSATHSENRSTGFYQLGTEGGTPQKLLHADKMLGGVIKAKQADAILLTQQSFIEFPDLWVSDLRFQNRQKISDANPQQAQYNWGTQELIDYVNGDGKKQKALLAKPENFDPKKKYPMMVYIYEKLSDNLHRHIVPAPSQNINVTRYLSNGYIVLRPDIAYRTGYPGQSALKAVVPAVKKVLAMGFVDPQRVGIQGHSWGAYQINYMLTKTTLFHAAEAGASMANMVSGYGGIRWGTGLSRAFQYERGQSRIGGTPWDSTKLFIENSPIFSINKVQTPYLTIHNDDDDAVPWYQAIEFFTALRHLQKEAYWFNYNGEKHGLRERDHIKHYTVHMAEFFDHYLLGIARPEWMDKPVPYLERGKRDVMGQFKPASAATP
ncbi:MAG: prolyl oligopeptidase family serine peptidase [Burkholderiaceae bacterium]|nr:prolyl oligopeptidase family serine peptidase [Burkholderiaceae bacterium]